jgi:hypothetical protein
MAYGNVHLEAYKACSSDLTLCPDVKLLKVMIPNDLGSLSLLCIGEDIWQSAIKHLIANWAHCKGYQCIIPMSTTEHACTYVCTSLVSECLQA